MVQTKRYKIWSFLIELIFLCIAAIYIVPIWMVLVNSFKSQNEANLFRLTWPAEMIWDNYQIVMKEANILLGLFNGLYIGGVVVLVTLLFASLAAFYLARSQTRLSNYLYTLFVAGLIIPIAILPTYFLFLLLGLNKTYLGLIAIFATYSLPLSIFLFTSFIKTIPVSLDEAATIDGCGPTRVFAYAIFPLLKPVGMTTAVFTFLLVWNESGIYLYFANSQKWPLTMGIYEFFGKYNQSWNLAFADIILGIIPCLLIFIIGQRFIVTGLTAGAVKG
ncbi:carbohydrate ABC transporter permease [Paenibacillus hemerocallicola]|uniref:Carbohydrate ABC transporter permease n=1 Tax=Paenibacillus hemerocallicola TaxID=1172614 RepID=A0A5C4TE94_9BACL|nr:carbohydrate ABC transporter permease [Paenibacillus hemerocallicola]TNJ66956.1 carbohydrate ABC transporter permease [Paenibacillus hemerocallicola]